METLNELKPIAIKLTDTYYGEPCKVLFKGKDLTQQKQIAIEEQNKDFEIKEIGYTEKHGYVFVLAAFNKKKP